MRFAPRMILVLSAFLLPLLLSPGGSAVPGGSDLGAAEYRELTFYVA